MRDQLDLYKFYRKFAKIKLRNLIDELHNAYKTRNTYFRIIEGYKDEINKSGLSFNHLNMLYLGTASSREIVPSSTKILDDEEMDTRLIALIKYFIYICIDKIPQLEELINIQSYVVSVPYAELVKIIRLYNKEVAREILLGQVYKMPANIGRFGIEIVKRPSDRKAIHWKESNIYKRYLLANGIEVKSYENPDGAEWLMFFTDDHYLRWNWTKKGVCKITNANYYFFRTSNYFSINRTVDDIEQELITKDDVLNTTLIGNLQKSLMISRKFNDIKDLYHYGV